MNRSIGAVAVAVAACVAPAPAWASHVCVEVQTDSTVGPPLVVGSQCVATPGHLCDESDIGLVPTVVVTVAFCVPR